MLGGLIISRVNQVVILRLLLNVAGGVRARLSLRYLADVRGGGAIAGDVGL